MIGGAFVGRRIDVLMRGSYLWVVEENRTSRWWCWKAIAGWTFTTRQLAREAVRKLRNDHDLTVRVMRYRRSYK